MNENLLKLINFMIFAVLQASSPLLLPQALADEVDLADLLSSQYEVRRNPKPKNTRSSPSNRAIRSPASDELNKKNKNSGSLTKEASSLPPSPESSQISETSKSPERNLIEKIEEPPLSEQFSSLFNKEGNSLLDYYSDKIHPEDIRNNRLEVDIHSMYSDIKSHSNYSYRQYETQFVGFDLGTNVWITPGIGITSRISYSIAASIPNSAPSNSNSLAKFEDLDFGFKFRRFFGSSRRANYFETTIVLLDSKINVLADDSQRMRTKTNGIAVLMNVYLPVSPHWTHHFGVFFAPRLSHSEASTGIEAFSGSPGDSNKFGLIVGSDLKFNRENQVLLDLGIYSEKNQFTGLTSLQDQDTNNVLNNTAVRTTTSVLRIGYRWGK